MTKEEAQRCKAEGNTCFSAAQYDEALQHFTSAINADGTDHVLYSNRSGAYAMLKNYQAALEDADHCIKLKSDWPKGYSRKGLALFKLGDLSSAAEAYEAGLEIEPNNKQLLDGLAETRRATAGSGAPDMSSIQNLLSQEFRNKIQLLLLKPKYRSYAAADPSYPETLLGAAMRVFDQDGLLGGIMGGGGGGGGLGSKRHSDSKIQEGLDELLGGLLGGAGTGMGASSGEDMMDGGDGYDFAAAAERQREARSRTTKEDAAKRAEQDRVAKMTTEEKEAETLKLKGNEHYKKHEFNDALLKYDAAIALTPNNLLLENNKAAVYLEMEDYDKCLSICEAAIGRRYEAKADFTTVAKIMNRMAVAYHRQKNYPKAVEMYQKSLLEDNNRHTRAALKDVERQMEKQKSDAYADPEKAEHHKSLGNEHYKAKDYVNAKKEYDEAIRRSPTEDSKLYANRAAALINLLEYPSALKDIEKSLDLDPLFVKGWSRKGNIHLLMKAYNQAQQAYNKGLAIDPENAECRLGMEKTMQKVIESQRSGEVDSEQMNQAMSDPEIQSIMGDPQFRLILNRIVENPSQLEEAMKDEKIAAGLRKLISAGILRLQ
eukprot:Lankesteria_metandrocarpae@DN892_c0_g1_i2.p1